MTGLRPMRRLPALLLAAVAAVALALGPVTAEPARAAPVHRVLLAGDSITQGSSGDYTYRYRLWTKLARTAPGQVAFVGPRTGLYDQVGNTQNRGFYAANFAGKAHGGLWGATLRGQLPYVRGDVTNARATTLVVLLGFNDVAWVGRPPAESIADLETYIARARQGNSGISVVVGQLLTPFDPWTGEKRFVPEVAAFNAALPGLVSRLNTSTSRVVLAQTAKHWNANVHTWDGTHPNPYGETQIAQRVSEALATLGIGTAAPNIHAPTAWGVRGPTPQLSSASKSAVVRWDRVPTGSNAMYVQQRPSSPPGAWQELPYPVSGDGFTAGLLAGGWTYQFRLAPAKGLMRGQMGAAGSVKAGN